MPRGDRTGPMGMGAMTGRGAGFCAGYSVPGFMNPVAGRRFGRGMGMGFRRGRGFGGIQGSPSPYSNQYASALPVTETSTREDELKILKEDASRLANTLDGINKRIAELQKE
ncbi:MAG: DUF5320 domain-containing protein [Planctomycetes bacterium]|nr:DUF5320 domain-containing protein [Planctomycetota bacterium]